MIDKLIEWSPNVKLTPKSISIDDLVITFHRTLRMPDNETTGELPPSMGPFPLFQTNEYIGSLPDSMAAKGGLFFPMYQREAMYIDFTSTHTYAVKIYVGGVNAVSGEPLVETAATLLRRRTLRRCGESLQDFVVTPQQPWLDGIAVGPKKVRQFVAMPMHSGHSVELQVTGEETTAGLQFEVTRLDFPPIGNDISIVVRARGVKILLRLPDSSTVDSLGNLLRLRAGIVASEPRLVYKGEQLEYGTTLASYGIQNNCEIHFIERLRGGGWGPKPQPEMSLAAGGFVRQNIVSLMHYNDYLKTATATFHVQILNSASFQAVTGRAAPPTPVSAKHYAARNLPFFVLYDEPSEVAGQFSDVRSVAAIDGLKEAPLGTVPLINVKNGKLVTAGNEASGKKAKTASIGILDMTARPKPLRFPWELAEEIRDQKNLF